MNGYMIVLGTTNWMIQIRFYNWKIRLKIVKDWQFNC